MIDVLTEDLIDLKAAAKLAVFAGPDGRRPHISTIYRYALRGARRPDGERVRLETCRTPRGTMTSRQAVQRFVDRLSERGEVAPIEHSRRVQRATATLDLAGV